MNNKKRQSCYFPPMIQLLQCALQGQPDTHWVTELVFVICNLTPSFNLCSSLFLTDLTGGPVVKNLPVIAGGIRDVGSIPGLESSPEAGNSNPFHYSCLENSMDRGAWQIQSMGWQRVRHNWAIEHACNLGLPGCCSLPPLNFILLNNKILHEGSIFRKFIRVQSRGLNFGTVFFILYNSSKRYLGFLGCASGKEPKNMPANAGDRKDVGLIRGSGRSPGGGHGNPLQYSCLENPWTEEPGRLQSIGL